ncbi:FosX/FosE/FosI family fosfomycin resistance hydrolase [Deinococcus aestuarii]|uniref:FosX/FosE/FosI family fosfomycin resistance hydrolase n=1 Tax=Deinococcus aestuarii TaxID=2774531 RepID=UPI001C0BD0A3|nr:FosX/FosE/FosI family fosfomycin resistance hydrolase [Deinococcus aestuarii]
MIQGLSHLTLIVRDLGATTRLLADGLGAEEVYFSGEATFSLSREKFFLLGGVWLAVMEGDPLPTQTYNHIAFQIREEDLDGCRERLQTLGVYLLPPRPRVEGEGRSLYFFDFDNHLFELHTGTLDGRLNRYRQGGPPTTPR